MILPTAPIPRVAKAAEYGTETRAPFLSFAFGGMGKGLGLLRRDGKADG